MQRRPRKLNPPQPPPSAQHNAGAVASISRRAADRLRQGHVWVYQSDIESLEFGDSPEQDSIHDSTGTEGSKPTGGRDDSFLSEPPSAPIPHSPIPPSPIPPSPIPPSPIRGTVLDRFWQENRAGLPGLVSVIDGRGLLLGTALFSPNSQITLRLVTTTRIDGWSAWLPIMEERLRRAIRSRQEFLDAETDACRLVFSEADQLPGLVIDRYGDTILLEVLSKALERRDVRSRIVDTLVSELDPAAIVERADPRIRKLEHRKLEHRELEQMRLPDGLPGDDDEVLVYSKDKIPQLQTIFHLNGLAFHYDAREGQKTGAFLDQRLNYTAAARHCHGRALDVCTYQGGFALHLARVCPQVTGVDVSRAALEVAEENLEVNRHRLTGDVDWLEANAFDLLRDWSDAGESFDSIVLDPPAFAKSKKALPGALRGYKELNLRALKMLRPGGTLVTCSCSHQVSSDEFQAVLASAAGDAHRRVRLLERRGAAPDHPVLLNIPETEYLKCLVLRVE